MKEKASREKESDWEPKCCRRSHGVGLWESIVQGKEKRKQIKRNSGSTSNSNWYLQMRDSTKREIRDCVIRIKKVYFQLNPFIQFSKSLLIPLFPNKWVWCKGVPSKVAFFLWNFVLEKILNVHHLQRRGLNLTNRCVLCSS